MDEVGEAFMPSKDTLIEGERQQKARENFLAQANVSYEKADQAVKLSAKILEEAQQTLNTLKGERARIMQIFYSCLKLTV